jgi:hypothetical protein
MNSVEDLDVFKLAYELARKTARMHGTPVYFWKNGKVVAEKP